MRASGEPLGMSGRHRRRPMVRYEEDGIARIARPSDRQGGAVPRPVRELARMHDLCRERYSDFTVKHFHEQLVRRHNYRLGYTVTRLSLQAAGLVAKARRGERIARSVRAGHRSPGGIIERDHQVEIALQSRMRRRLLRVGEQHAYLPFLRASY